MKKIFYLLLIISLILAVASCKRTDIADPAWDGPAGFNILLEGSVTPALMLIDGRIHTSEIVVLVTDSKGNPLTNKTVFIEQLADQYATTQINWGYFPGNQKTTRQVTDSNGVIRVTFYWPTQYYSEEMWIHALMVIDGRAIKESEQGNIGNIPQDYISLTMYRAGGAAIGTTK